MFWTGEPVAEKIRLLIVEDNSLLREGISAIVRRQPDMNVLSEPGSNKKLLQKIREFKPNVLLLDLGLKYQSNLELVKMIKSDFLGTKVIGMDLAPTEADILMYVQAGVSGFVLKDAATSDFLKTIRAVARGKKVLPSIMTGSLFSQIVEDAVTSLVPPSRVIEAVRMTKRERQVILLVADGLSNKEIAYKLHLSPYTVKSHVHNILEKLLLRTRFQIAKYALANSEAMRTEESISFING